MLIKQMIVKCNHLFNKLDICTYIKYIYKVVKNFQERCLKSADSVGRGPF